ncbi:hypothetical protein PRIPAC_93812, partial [Pristionchus pacificus]
FQMRIIQFIIPWSTFISTVLAQISNPTADLNVPQTYPIDPTFYNHFLANQAQLNQALLMQNNLLPANSRLPTQQAFPNFPQQNLRLNPNNVDLFNQQIQNVNQLPSQSFFDPLSIQAPLTDIPTVITVSFTRIPSFVVPQQNPSESYLGGIPSQSEHRNSRALTVKSFVGVEKSAESSTISPSTTKKPEDSEQVRLIRKLLEETLAEQRNKDTSMTVSTTTTTQQPTTEKEEKSSLESVAELALLDRLNLNETEKNAIISRVEELLRAEIARKLLSEVSPPPPPPPPPPHAEFPSTTSTISPSSTISSTTSSPSTTLSTSPQSTTESTTITSPPKTTSQSIVTTSSPQFEAAPVITADGASHEKTKLKSLALKQKKSTVVGGRSIVRPIELSESIDDPVSLLRVSTVQKEIREAQPRLPSRFIHNTKKDFDEDLDLIDRSGGERRPDTVAAASLLTSARRITYPNDYEEEETINHKNDFFQPITGAPLDLTDVYEDDEDGGLVDIDSTQRRREQFRAISTRSPFSLRTTARPFHDETTTVTLSSSSFPFEPINLETVTTPPYRNGRYGQHRATKFEVLASDYRSRLRETGDLGHILKRLSQNAYIALIESDGGNKRTRHESRPRRRRNTMRL